MMRNALVLMVVLLCGASWAQAPSPAPAAAGVNARSASSERAVAPSRDPVFASGGLAAGASVAWIYEERSRLVHACVFNPAEGGRIECWSKGLTESKPSR